MSQEKDQLWGIILAGGEGQRVRQFLQFFCGHDRPKQYCAIIGTRSMLRHTIDRVQRLIPRDRLLIIVTRSHLPYANEDLQDRPKETIIVQPCNRETGPGLLLPLLHVHHRNPEAIVACFPSDHFIVEEERFLEHLDAASALASAHPDLPILLGVEPEGPDAGYGWIEPGEMIAKVREVELSLVRRFWEKPDPRKAQALYLKGCLWNTLILVCQAERLLQMFKAHVPAVFRRLERIRRALGSVSEGRVLEEVYQRLTSVNFSKAILEKKAERLGVIPMKGVHWSDWGDPARILKSLTRWGLRPNPPV